MLLPLVLLFVLVPIAELAIIIQVGQAIGLWPTIAILLADSVLGAVLLRSQGRATWRRFNDALTSGRAPAREVLDGGLVIFGAACLLTPGFLTDGLGVAFLLPPSRAVLRRLLMRHFAGRMVRGMQRRAFRPSPWPAAGAGAEAGARDAGADVEGTAHELTDAERRLRP